MDAMLLMFMGQRDCSWSCARQNQTIHKALLSGRALCQCGLTDGVNVPDEEKEVSKMVLVGEGTYDVVIYMSYCWWHVFKFFSIFAVDSGLRTRLLLTSLDDAQNFSTQWSSCNTPGPPPKRPHPSPPMSVAARSHKNLAASTAEAFWAGGFLAFGWGRRAT